MNIREEIKLDGIREGIERGRQEGRQEGKKEGRKEVILNMLRKKFDISVISEATGLSEEEIDQIKNSHKC